MKKNLVMLALFCLGLGLVGCKSDDSALWRIGAYQQENKVLKEYCRFDFKKGFRYELMLLELDDKGKASYANEDSVKEAFNEMTQTSPQLLKIFKEAQKSTILGYWKDDPTSCGSTQIMMRFFGMPIMNGVEVGRE